MACILSDEDEEKRMKETKKDDELVYTRARGESGVVSTSASV